ncbi:MAG TPA: FAD-dependent oxidoreductase [Polyangia bacterium]
MADARFATCTNVEVLGPDTRAFSFTSDEAVGFTGGQYLIADTGLVVANGKAVKRAYSFVSRDREQHRFVLASQRLPEGPGSNFLHGLAAGDRLKWSGPWGKLAPRSPDPSRTSARTLVLATDTGITAALGVVSGERFAPHLSATRFVWMRTDARDFLPDEWVRARLPLGLALEIAPVPPPPHPERLAHVLSWLAGELVPGRLGAAFLTGDGAINYAILDRLVALGLPLTRDDVESFFNYPKKPAVTVTKADIA